MYRRIVVTALALAALAAGCSSDDKTNTANSSSSVSPSTMDLVTGYDDPVPTTAPLTPGQQVFCDAVDKHTFDLRASNASPETTPTFIAALRALEDAAPPEMKGPYGRVATALEQYNRDPNTQFTPQEQQQLLDDAYAVGNVAYDLCGISIVKRPPKGVTPATGPLLGGS